MSSFNLSEFKNPKRKHSIVYSWLWGSVITREIIDKRLDELLAAGIKSFYIIPLPKDFRPEILRTFLEPEYLSEEFFELIKYTYDGAKARGLELWLYDEGGWPSGGANYSTVRECPEAAIKLIKTRERRLSLGENYIAPEDTVATFYEKKRLTTPFIAFKEMTVEEHYLKRLTDSPNLIDLTCEEAIDTFIGNTYAKYKECLGEGFKKDIPVFFTDEPTVMTNSLPDGAFEEFERRYGYDFRDYLYVLKDYGSEAVTEEEVKARIDYGRMLGELLRDNGFKKLRDWCRENGTAFGGHLNNDNIAYGGMYCGCFSLVECLRRFDVPGIDVIWEQIRYPYGDRNAVNDETRDFPFFPRLASSAARQTGRVDTLSESLAIYGDGITPEEIKFILNYQLVRGINRFNLMSMPSTDKRCGALMCRPSFSPSKPGFFNLKHLHEYYERLCYLATLGKPEGDTALYHPAADYFADPKTVLSATKSFGKEGIELERKNIPFDIIDDYGILDAEITPEGLKLGDAVYKHIVVPECKYMPKEVKERIAPFVGKGEPICTPKCDKIRIMTRIVDNSRLYFFFNEGIETVTERFDIKGDKRLYEIDPRSGCLYERNAADPTLLCGEVAVYLVTDMVLDCASEEIDYSVEVKDFAATSYERFLVSYSGCELKKLSGAPEITDDFSGSVYYSSAYELPREPKADERYRILLFNTSVSASVYIDEEKICDFGILPMWAEVTGDLLKKKGKITVKVSNTAANELVAKKQFINDTFPKGEVGAYTNIYTDRQTLFEERKPRLSFGSVRIDKIK